MKALACRVACGATIARCFAGRMAEGGRRAGTEPSNQDGAQSRAAKCAGEKTLPKQKTHRGAKKRFKITSGGKVLRHHSMRSHILTKKTTKKKRKLRQSTEVQGKFAASVKQMIQG